MVKNISLSLLFITSILPNIYAQSVNDKMEWWRDARFGMFIHWGIYARMQGHYRGHEQRVADGAWMLNRMKMPVQEYKDSARNFNPINYNPEEWVLMAKNAGMKYLVITAKHHDGFALFDSKASDWDIMDATPYKKDLLKPLVAACKKHGMKLGFYYSQSQDWGNAGGGTAFRPMNQGWPNPDSARIDAYARAHKGSWDPVQQTKTYEEYFRNVAMPQVKELLTNYGDVAVIWWDTPMNANNALTKEMFDLVKKLQPRVIQNDRLKAPGEPGDYKTPEQKIPNLAQLDGKDWETCMTMNNSWGYRAIDKKWKSSATLIRNLIDIASKGGNYLLNIGPKADGTFPQESIDRLNDMGQWMKKYGNSIYGTRANPAANVSWGRITAKDNNGSTTLYLHVFDWPANGVIEIDSVQGKATKAQLLKGNILKIKQNGQKLTISHLPARATDENASVIAVEFQSIIPKKNFEAAQKMKVGALD